jgi:hypothetical protein
MYPLSPGARRDFVLYKEITDSAALSRSHRRMNHSRIVLHPTPPASLILKRCLSFFQPTPEKFAPQEK